MRHLYRSYRLFCDQNQARLLNISKRFDSTATSGEKIVIPKRIQRSPTDILYALSATVGHDPTAAHYKYHDDQYLIPQSNPAKRSFALSQEAGRNAARWIKQEHSKLFQHKHADPAIPAYVPTMVYTEDSEVKESSLEQLIANAQVSDAILVYNLMVKRNINISSELRQSFLELICFNNQDDFLSEDLFEERWFSQSNRGKERARKTWKDGDLAESVFNEIEPKTSQAYCAIIRGMCKFIQVDRGYALYQDAIQRGLQVDVATFNSVLRVISFLKEAGGNMRWQMTQEILQMMALRKVKPDIQTMNAVLSVISSIHGSVARQYALQTLAEFKQLGFVPTLESWYFVLSIFYRDRDAISHVLFDIMKEIEGKEFKIQGLKDTLFFLNAMDVCQNFLNDKDLAKRVDNLLHFGHNYDLIGSAYNESVYYRHYFTVLCNNEPLDVFMQTYNALVPNVYIPEPIIMTKILMQVDTNGALELIPRLWSDIVVFEQANQEKILDLVLKIMVDNKPISDIPAQVNLTGNFADIAWDIFTKIEEQSGRRNHLNWSGKMVSDVLTLICRSDDYEKAQVIFDKINNDQDIISGVVDPAALELFIKLSVSNKQPSKAVAALQYCVENSFSNNQELGRFIVNEMTLHDHHISKITSLVGTEVLKGN